jgi:ADP-ribosyl-[dinitrogen reductase] hydrolase
MGTDVAADVDTDCARGVLLGLACGDALGRPVEFRSAEAIAAEHGRLTEMVGDGTWGQPPGTVTDDTDQALCLARSLVERGTFDPADVADRFVDWLASGPFDVGVMTRRSIERLRAGDPWDEAGQAVWAESPEGSNAGNGSVMRAPPVAVAYRDAPAELVRTSRDSSRITHADPRCTAGCAVVNLTVAALLEEVEAPLAGALDRVRDSAAVEWPEELETAVRPIAAGERDDLDLRTSGYVVHTLQTALADALAAPDAETAIVRAVNRGGDADTIGAVAGALAGARFGASTLPERWLDALNPRADLERLADELAGLEPD